MDHGFGFSKDWQSCSRFDLIVLWSIMEVNLYLVSTDELILEMFCIWKRFLWNSWDMQKADHKEIIPFRSCSLWWVSTSNWIFLSCGGPPLLWFFIFTYDPAGSNFHLRYRFSFYFSFLVGQGGFFQNFLIFSVVFFLKNVCIYSPISLSPVGHRILRVDRESGVCSNLQFSNLGILGLPYWMAPPLETFYAT